MSFADQRTLVIERYDAAHTKYYSSEVFSGPSLHFHIRALEAGRLHDLERFSESVYALLVSWGMHRMGRGGPKMRDFEPFRQSLAACWADVLDLKDRVPSQLGRDEWLGLERIFRTLQCMVTGTSLVANSKVMAHALPNLVAPIDREYTLRFLFGRTDIVNGLDAEWRLFHFVHQDFYYPLLEDSGIRTAVSRWISGGDTHPWDTSLLKVLDNLVIGLVRLKKDGELPARAAV